MFIIYIEGAAKVERIITGLSVLDIDKGEHNSSYSQANHILATRFHEVEMMVYILCILNNKFKFYYAKQLIHLDCNSKHRKFFEI